MAKKLTSKKAKQILHDKSVHGHPLTDKQRKFFGAVASGYIKAQDGVQFNDDVPNWLYGAQYPKRIQDEKQREFAIKNFLFAVADDFSGDVNAAEEVLYNMNQGYGSDRVENQVLRDYYGFDYADIIPERVAKYKQEYTEAFPGNSQMMEEPKEEFKNGGWLDKYSPKAQNGIEGTMGGLTDKGFNYNGAWGGTMQMGGNIQPPMAGANQTLPMYAVGGSLPGSVGFTYARTGSTPSEGPYAKKTMPSADNGMSFYQHGLDWKPRNISENGSVVKDNMGYWNPDNWGRIVEIDSPNITMKGVNQPLIGISDEGDIQYMEPGKDYKFKGKKVKEYPIAKNGSQQDRNQLVKLDQLTNFTNYNKPEKGGWLSKYE